MYYLLISLVNKMLNVPNNAISAAEARELANEELNTILQNVFDDIQRAAKSDVSIVNNDLSFTIPWKYSDDEILDEIVDLFKQLGYVINYEKVSADYSACPPIQAHVWFRVLW